MVVADRASGLPVLPALSLCTCCRHYPGTATGGTALLIRPVMSAFPERVIGSACALSFSRLTQRSLALRPAHSRCHLFVARLPEGFRHFVSSMPAPVASGWSGCRVGFAPTGKRRLVTAHTHSGPKRRANWRPKPALQRREQRCTARSCSSTPSGFQRQRTHRFFVERLALGKQALERLRIENGFEFSEELCASALYVWRPNRCARVAEQCRR